MSSTKPDAVLPQLEQDEVEEELGKQAVRLANAVVLPMVLKSALELNLIDIISAAGEGACLSPSEIAAHLPTGNTDAPVLLDRMLRLLASYDILTCSLRNGEGDQVQRLYGLRPICRFLTKSQGGGSLGPLFLLHHDKVLMKSWYHLKDVILEGGVPFDRAYGMRVFEYGATDQRFSSVAQQRMTSHVALIMNRVLDIYKGFEGLQVLVDVGVFPRTTLSAINSKYPYLKVIDYDLIHIIAHPPSGVEHAGGDILIEVPKGDAILMKWILHDWSDEYCMMILNNCFEALPNSGKLIVIESILPEAPDSSVSSQIAFAEDMSMLAQTQDGKERTHKEYEALAKRSGFSSCEVICCAYNSWVMEFHKTAKP